jgi:DNA-binding NarL/FixJ family response regulator
MNLNTRVYKEARVLIVADNPLARTGLAALLSQQMGYQVVGQIPSSQDLVNELDIYLPNVIIWDFDWVTLHSERLIEWREIRIPIIGLLADEEAASILWNAGIRAILPQQIETDELTAVLYAVLNGLVVIHPRLVAAITHNKPTFAESPLPSLTPRELEVLQLLAQGLTNKAIAHQLKISDHTVKFHVNAIMSKLNVQSRTEAVVHATRLGWVVL